jgi:outer membrane protein OmpA-like peptidoglycan-associated protein
MKHFSSHTGFAPHVEQAVRISKPLLPDGAGRRVFRSAAGFLKHLFPIIILSLFPAVFLRAQTAAEMDGLLETHAVTCAQAARFTLAAADIVGESSPPRAAYTLAVEKGWLPEDAAPDSPLSAGDISFLVMEAFGMKGSFLYSLFPGPRYAFRELDYLRLLPGRRDPALSVPGRDLLWILGAVSAHTGMEQEPPAVVEQPAGPPPLPVAAVPAGTAAPEPPVEVAAAREQLAVEISAELEQTRTEDTQVRVSEEGVVISLENIQFLPDQTQLMEGEKARLREIAVILKRYPDRKILVTGHSAMAGTAAGRMEISEQRARAVADFLLSLDVRAQGDISIRGYGAEILLGDSTTAAGRALNRRAEIILMDAEGQ